MVEDYQLNAKLSLNSCFEKFSALNCIIKALQGFMNVILSA